MTKKVRAGAVELGVVDEGAGAAIVFLHGFPLDHSMWLAQVDTLSDRFRCIAPDLRGFGVSSIVPGVAGMDQMADDVAALLDTLGVTEPITLCGLSMGGYVAFQFLRKHRQRVARLILCDTRSVADTAEAAKTRHETAEKVVELGPRVIWQAMRDKLFASQSIRKQPQLIAAYEQVVLRADPEGIAAALLGMAARPDVSGDLPLIEIPTLVVVGEQDAISPPAEMRQIADAIPQADYVVISDAGHMSPVENPDEFTKALRDFLARSPQH